MAELVVPKIDFSPLADLPKIYEEGAKKRTLADIGRGLADGSLDYNSAGAKLAGLGDLNSGLSLIKLGQEQQAGQDFMRRIPSLYGSGQAASSGQPQSVSNPMGNAGPTVSSDPRGIRNNNPLNLEASPFTQSQPGFSGLDGRFGKFGSVEQGMAAADKLLAGYGQRGINSIAGVINRWAPANDGNPVSAYANFVAQKAGIDPNARIDLSDPTVRAKILPAMAEFENGRPVQVASNDPSVGVPQPQQTAQPQQAPQPQAQPQGDGLSISPRIQTLLQAVANPRLPSAHKDVAKILLQRELDASKLPDAVKKYMFARSQGYQGSLMDYETELKKAGATAITTNMRGENAEAAAIGKAAGERAAETMKTAGAATKSLANVSRIEALLNQVSQGKLEPARMTVSAWAKSLGLNSDAAEALGLDPKGVGSAQALQALINESVVGKIGSGGFPANNFSDADREFLVGIFPQLGNDPRANRILTETAKRVYQTDREKGRAWLAFRRNPNTRDRSFDDFEMEWADKVAKEDRFGDLRHKAEEIIGSPRAVRDTVSSPAARPPGSSQTPHSSNVPRVTSPAEVKSLGLKSGDRFLDDAGNIRQVP
ncbi:MAG TPA: hypothetical protein VNQ99_04820 [Xanthobacteraceae bacterium]|nr:hypothetical protein [Xanthobacteraceae bacterium]